MAAAAAALLDELMGRNRNAAPNEKGIELNWEDPEYCKYYLVSFCPHDLFVNTRADLGPCAKVHDDEVKRLYEESTSHKKFQYLDDFIRFCNNILSDVQRKIEKGRQRLSLMNSSEKVAMTPAQAQRNQEQMTLLTEKINKLVEEAEAAGIKGNVEQAQGLMKLCDQLKEERTTLRENSHWQQTASLAAEQEKQMEVCQVCGAFLIVGDAQQRIDDHLMGKQHVGYARLKTAVEEMTKERDRLREERERKRDSDKRDRFSRRDDRRRGVGVGERDRRTDGDRDRDRERDRDRDRQRERDRDRDRERDRERERDRDRERERDRERHDSRRHDHRREEEKHRMERERERDRDRDRTRRDEHRDRRDRHRKSEREEKEREYRSSRSKYEDERQLKRSRDRDERIHMNGDELNDKHQ